MNEEEDIFADALEENYCQGNTFKSKKKCKKVESGERTSFTDEDVFYPLETILAETEGIHNKDTDPDDATDEDMDLIEINKTSESWEDEEGPDESFNEDDLYFPSQRSTTSSGISQDDDPSQEQKGETSSQEDRAASQVRLATSGIIPFSDYLF